MKALAVCLYCGFRDDIEKWSNCYNNGAWGLRCKVCEETKNIRKYDVDTSSRDVFGYRFSAPFPQDKNKSTEEAYGERHW